LQLKDEFFTALDRLGPFGPAPRLAVAVSGGADSMALALLASDWCGQRGGCLTAIIVDHGLRTASAAEAEATRARLEVRGISARIITLSGLHPGPAMQERARAARYDALAQGAREAGCVHLLLGHHEADQAETVAMRAARGPHGLEGMAAWTSRNDVLILRPLLGFAPARLRDYLRGQDMGWVEDPSNADPKFERVRLRLMPSVLGIDSSTSSSPDLRNKAWMAGSSPAMTRQVRGSKPMTVDVTRPGVAPADPARRQATELEAAEFLARHATIRPEGFAVIHGDAAPPAALGALLRMLGGKDFAPARDAVAALAAGLRAVTIGGVRIAAAGRHGPGWLLAREPASCAPPVPAVAGAVWDRRFRLRESPGTGIMFGALGADAAKFRQAFDLPSFVLRAMPCLRGPDGGVRFPAPAIFAPPAPAAGHPFLA
jgi:tRNA(Ile)-lysidine synthase